MSSVLPLATLIALMVPGADAPAGKSSEVSVHFQDSSVLHHVTLRDVLEIQTRYGKLSIPIADVRRVEFGQRIPEDVARRTREAVKNLGHEQFVQREAAEKVLLAIGKPAYPALLIAAQSPDQEIARRAKSLLQRIREALPEEELEFRTVDMIYTHDCLLTGRLLPGSFKANTRKLGDLTLQLSDLKALQVMASTSGEVAIDAAPFAGAPERWLDTGFTLEPDIHLVLTATGSVDLDPRDSGKCVSGPEGRELGKNAGFLPGTLLGRIGEKGDVFIIGKRYEGKANAAGKLQVHVVPPASEQAPIGAFRLRINTGFELATNPDKNQPLPPAVAAGNLAGVIMIGNKAAADVEVIFIPVRAPKHKGISAATDKDGTFEMLEVPIGDYKVVVKGKGVPAKYSDPARTPLTFKLQKGDNISVFTLEE